MIPTSHLPDVSAHYAVGEPCTDVALIKNLQGIQLRLGVKQGWNVAWIVRMDFYVDLE